MHTIAHTMHCNAHKGEGKANAAFVLFIPLNGGTNQTCIFQFCQRKLNSRSETALIGVKRQSDGMTQSYQHHGLTTQSTSRQLSSTCCSESF